MGSPYDKPLLHDHPPFLRDESPYSERLWRPESSAECADGEADRSGARSRTGMAGKRTRIVLVAGALSLGLGLLVLWLLLLLGPPEPAQNPTTTMSTTRGDESTKTMVTSTMTIGKKPHHHHHHHSHIVVPSAIPVTTTMRATSSKGSSRSTTVKMYAKLDFEEGRRRVTGSRVIAQIKRIKAIGTTATTLRVTDVQTPITTMKPMKTATTTTSSSTTTATTTPSSTTTPLTKTTTTTTKSPSTTTEPEREAEVEDAYDDLFWMRDHRKRPFRPTFHRKTTATTTTPISTTTDPLITTETNPKVVVNPDSYEVKRPTIEFGPIRAKEMTTETEQAKQEEQVRQELEAIIASVEREAEGPESPEVNPVEIPFDPTGSPEMPVPEPVWRRPPPSAESGHAAPPPPPPMAPKTETKEESALDGVQLRRKRREAPVMVTALLDIGRGEWQRFTRHFDQYLGYLANILLRLQNHMIIYCDPSVTAYLRGLGDQIGWERLQVVEMSLKELPFHRFRDEIEGIMRWEQAHWHNDWDEQMRAHPETMYPDYDILVNSKPYFLFNATQISRFPTPDKQQQFFVWLDAGYGHGSTSAIPYGVWSPELKAGKITLVQLTSKLERVERYSLEKVYRKQRSVVSGGFLAGSPDAIRRFWTFFHKSFLEMLDSNMVDDDQTTLLVTIRNFRATFHILFGGWFDAFKLLPSQQK